MSESYPEIRESIRELCLEFPGMYWQRLDAEQRYPEEFVSALTSAGWMAALIPEEYGGAGLGLAEASVILEEINRSGGNSGACHGQLYNMGTLLRHGSEEQKRAYLPRIARGDLRLQSMAVTEPTTGTDTTKTATFAVRRGDRYVVNGQKVWLSRARHSDLLILLARTTPLAERALEATRSGRTRILPERFEKTWEHWLTDIREKEQMDAAWKAWVDPDNKPVRACVEARLGTPDTRVEIMVTAAK